MGRQHFFEPWVGERYSEGFRGVRTLVVGVCHICTLPCDRHEKCLQPAGLREMDCMCPAYSEREEQDYYRLSRSNEIEIASFVDGEARYPAYSAFTYYMLGLRDECPAEKKAELWNCVAFTNYL